MSNAPVLDDEEVLEQVSFKKNELPKDDMDDHRFVFQRKSLRETTTTLGFKQQTTR